MSCKHFDTTVRPARPIHGKYPRVSIARTKVETHRVLGVEWAEWVSRYFPWTIVRVSKTEKPQYELASTFAESLEKAADLLAGDFDCCLEGGDCDPVLQAL